MKSDVGIIISRGPSSEWHAVSAFKTDLAVDQSQHLIEDPARPVQLRPILGWEALQVSAHPGNRVLVCRSCEPELRAYVRLPKAHRENTPANVELAIREVEKFGPKMGRLFRDAIKHAASAGPRG